MSRKKMVDAVDIQILKILQKDGRITGKELSNQISLSEAATHIRLQNLIKRKVISSINAWVDFARFGYSFKALLIISVVGSKKQWLFERLKGSGKTTLVIEVRREEYQLTDVVCVYSIVVFKSRQLFVDFAKDLILDDEYAVVSIQYYEITNTIIAVPEFVL